MANERITAKMTAEQMVMAMSDRNPGACAVCMQLLKNGDKIDPDAFCGGLASILDLDMLGIYGHRIWGLYKYVCGSNLSKMIAVLRANQLGQLAGVNKQVLDHAIDNNGSDIDFEAVMKEVKNHLPNFNPEVEIA